ncbi:MULTISPECIES: ABC transporter permease [unclassified Halanaerobium]|uniref:ABC transporter permease n=1 Tax=unclassified Halanaerobium TaxID=2641197 RepID=UPI000DF4263E|nr:MULTISPECIES: ABC transporter permease [unclassified Halanaerobium]RCW43760.1 nucleoside ABC transporter membrane protein [Halanaerobium sp. MA284_MarDTE_T2]RCW89171.1 nucleoside ABC transporter membrane protein [Halanaerobium sp. DL-01]
MNDKLRDFLYERQSLLNVFIAVFTAMIVGTLVIYFMGYDILESYEALYQGAFKGRFNFGGTLERFVPLLLSGLAFAVASKASIFNIGVEGQLYFGAITAAFFGYIIKGVPSLVHIPVTLLLAAAAGGLWAVIPGFLRAKYNVNEVTTTIMLNYVAIFFVGYIVNHPFKNPNVGVPQTPNVQPTARLPKIMLPSRANIGIFIALALLVFFIWLLNKTTFGYKVRAVGFNPFFTDYVGVKSKLIMVLTMFLSGAIGGVLGGVEVLGIHGYVLDNFSPGYGFDGIMVGLLARNNLKALPFVAFFLAALRSGAINMERFTGVPKEVIGVIEAVIILLAAAEVIVEIKKRKSSDKGGVEVG